MHIYICTINTVIDKLCLDRSSNKSGTGIRIVHSAKQNTRDVNKRLFLSPIGNIFDNVEANTYNKIIICYSTHIVFKFKFIMTLITNVTG